MIRFAVIADPHVHDCNWVPSGSGLAGAIRSFEETGQSTRVFNESVPAFRAALTAAADAGAKLVLLVGDLTDDGQGPNICKALEIIEEFQQSHGLRVLTTPGNHDFHALVGRPQCKAFLGQDGARFIVDSRTCPEAAMLGTQDALVRLSGLGFVPQSSDIYWETPFGKDADWSARSCEVFSPQRRVSCDMIDASYLVEPVHGLWVLSIDANVCVPRDDASDFADASHFLDPGKSGWNSVARHRPHLLPWINDVTKRARELGKQLVAFSHYPPVDVLGNTAAREIALFGAKGSAQRMPEPKVAEALAAAGVSLHFSGHLHINDSALYASPAGRFVNIAVSSPVGYGAALKLVDLDVGGVHVRTLPLRLVPDHDSAFAAYQAEAALLHELPPPASMAADYGQFLDRHLRHLVRHRYLPGDWPPDMVSFVQQSSMSDLMALLHIPLQPADDFPLICLVEDWYRLRKAGVLAFDDIGATRIATYQRIATLPRPEPEPGLAAHMSIVLDILLVYMIKLPNGDFTILPSMDFVASTHEW